MLKGKGQQGEHGGFEMPSPSEIALGWRLNKMMVRFLQPPCCPILAAPGMWAPGHPALVGFGWTPTPGARGRSSSMFFLSRGRGVAACSCPACAHHHLG